MGTRCIFMDLDRTAACFECHRQPHDAWRRFLHYFQLAQCFSMMRRDMRLIRRFVAPLRGAIDSYSITVGGADTRNPRLSTLHHSVMAKVKSLHCRKQPPVAECAQCLQNIAWRNYGARKIALFSCAKIFLALKPEI